jgi:hypothetical protein
MKNRKVQTLQIPTLVSFFGNSLKTDNLRLQAKQTRGRGGRNRMVVGFTTIYEISAYHH